MTIELPLFPLPLALYPGTPRLLHVFEPRYRQLLTDCLAGDRRFGLSMARSPDGAPRVGDVGCRARIQSHHTFSDGRSNILVVGEERFVIETLITSSLPYPVARVSLFQDDPTDDSSVSAVAEAVWRTFLEIRATAGDEAEAGDEHPDDPHRVSFEIAAAIDFDLEVKEELLRLRSTTRRLERLRDLLPPVLETLKERAEIQRRAKNNGRGTRGPAIQSDS